MQLCAITDRKRANHSLLSLVDGWSRGGVDFIQLREKDLDATALRSLAAAVKEKMGPSLTRLLINVSTPEAAALAFSVGADGVHLAGNPTPGAAGYVREAFSPRVPVISVPCHSLEDVDVAYEEKVELILFSPVFEKVSGDEMFAPQGLEGLRAACARARSIPVLALGGVTAGNASDCLAAGAAGVAGIRLFAGDDWRRL